MPASIVSAWKRIAQSGPTIDGRFIKPEWLTDMGETYNPEVYTAKLWVDHMRYSSYGSVRALKAEQDGEVIRLFAKISPSRSLLQLNQVWEEKLNFSIEPTEDFAKTGKCYLTGLGMTDSPASLGTDEMRFSQIPGRDFTARYPGEAVPDLRKTDEDQEVERFGQKFARWFTHMNKNEQDKTPMDEKQFKVFKDSIEATQQTVAGMAEIIQTFVSGQAGGGDTTTAAPAGADTDTGNESTPADGAKFSELKTGMDALGEKFDKILTRLETAAPGTQFGDTTQAAGDKDELL
jgi:hypothetical protein